MDNAHLGEGQRVELVLRCKLKAAGLLGLDVVACLGTDLDGAVNLLVVAGSNDAQVLSAGDAGVVGESLVANTKAVLGDGGLLDVVSGLTTNEETLVAGGHVHDGIDGALSGGVVDERAGVDVGVLEGEVELLGGRLWLGWVPEVLEVDLDAGSDAVLELDLGIKQGSSGPCLSDGNTFRRTKSQPKPIC